jgi:replication-associated recombination protein RarA
VALRDLLRPKTLTELIGQEDAKNVVQAMIRNQTWDHLLLFGPSGTGKTTLALIAARQITGQEAEGISLQGWYHLNSAQCGNKEDIENVVRLSHHHGLKIFIFDEAHKITSDSQTLLLSALEHVERPTFYFFCTTEPRKLIYELRTRCQKVKFEWLTPEKRLELIQHACRKLDVKAPAGFVEEIQRRGLGNPRAILNALESVIGGISIAEAVDLEMPDSSPRGKKRLGRQHLRERIRKLLQGKVRLSVREVAKEAGCSPDTVQRERERLGLKSVPGRRLSA